MIATMCHEPSYVSGFFSDESLGLYAGCIALEHSLLTEVGSGERSDIGILISGEVLSQTDSVAGEPYSGTRDRILQCYLKRGEEFIERLEGLFSGLLVDKPGNKAYLFNDRYGSERIYFHQKDNETYFASEAKALLRVLPELRTFDPDGIAQYLAFGCTLNWQTLFKGIHILPGGSLWRYDGENWIKRRYFDPKVCEALPSIPEADFQPEFEAAFKRVLPEYFTSNISLGVALTGGLDTRMIMACRPGSQEKLTSYTFTGEVGETRDDRIAARVASVCGIEHHLLRLNGDFFSNFASHADETVYVTDGSLGITGAHEIFLNRQAREVAPVRLTGLFGSELLRGVSTFKPTGLPGELLQPEVAQRVVAIVNASFSEKPHPITHAAFRNVAWNLFGSMAASRSQVVLRTPYLDREILALAYQVPASLRGSPQIASRLIHNNNRLLAEIPTDRRIEDRDAGFPRNIMRLSLEIGFKLDYYHNEGMPQWAVRFDPLIDKINARVRIFGHHKFLHYRRWFTDKLAPYVINVVTDDRVHQMPFWNRRFLDHIAAAQKKSRGNYVMAINAILTLEAIERLLFKDLPRETKFDPVAPPSIEPASIALH